jgi:acyl carrier protein
MDRTQIFGRLLSILRQFDDKLDVDAMRLDDAPLRSYGIDSLCLVRLACAVEEEFGITIDDAEAAMASSFVLLVSLIDRKHGPATEAAA